MRVIRTMMMPQDVIKTVSYCVFDSMLQHVTACYNTALPMKTASILAQHSVFKAKSPLLPNGSTEA